MYGGKGLCKEGTIGNTLPQEGTLTKQRTYIMAILGTGILNNYHMVLNLRNSLVSHPNFASAAHACRRAAGATSSSNFCFCPFCCLKKVCRIILRPPLALVCIFTTSACSSAAAMCSSSAPVSLEPQLVRRPLLGLQAHLRLESDLC